MSYEQAGDFFPDMTDLWSELKEASSTGRLIDLKVLRSATAKGCYLCVFVCDLYVDLTSFKSITYHLISMCCYPANIDSRVLTLGCS